MNLRRPNANEVTNTFNRSRNVVPMSGICTGCLDGCKGGCETWLASFRGREVLYPARFGKITAGADKDYPMDYSHLNIQGYAVGAEGLPVSPTPLRCVHESSVVTRSSMTQVVNDSQIGYHYMNPSDTTPYHLRHL
jgi:glutamate synthase domain-containing protein 2